MSIPTKFPSWTCSVTSWVLRYKFIHPLSYILKRLCNRLIAVIFLVIYSRKKTIKGKVIGVVTFADDVWYKIPLYLILCRILCASFYFILTLVKSYYSDLTCVDKLLRLLSSTLSLDILFHREFHTTNFVMATDISRWYSKLYFTNCAIVVWTQKVAHD